MLSSQRAGVMHKSVYQVTIEENLRVLIWPRATIIIVTQIQIQKLRDLSRQRLVAPNMQCVTPALRLARRK